MLKFGLPTIVVFSIVLFTTMPSKPAIGFCLLAWIMLGMCWGYRHVTSTTTRNRHSDYSVPPFTGM